MSFILGGIPAECVSVIHRLSLEEGGERGREKVKKPKEEGRERGQEEKELQGRKRDETRERKEHQTERESHHEARKRGKTQDKGCSSQHLFLCLALVWAAKSEHSMATTVPLHSKQSTRISSTTSRKRHAF